MGESSSNADVAVTIQGLVDPIIHDLPIVVSPHQAAGSADARVDLDPKWVLSTDRKLLIRPRKIKATFSSCSIHRVPMDFRKLNENACVPQIISIGPFHYAKRSSDLQAMEEHKWRYARDFLTRNEEQSLERYLQTVKNLEQRARDCYSEEIDLDSNDFVEMMVLDACFIIELFLRIWDRAENCHPSDPVLNLGLLPTITTDLIMLENQIPFFILQHLFNLTNIVASPLQEMAQEFFSLISSIESMMNNCNNNDSINHLLHFLHLSFHPSIKKEDSASTYEGTPIPCVSELQEAGIKFKKGVDGGFLDIKYQDGVIEMPPLHINKMAESLFVNLVAFEQYNYIRSPYITSYIIFMDFLISSAKDVEILTQKGIIVKEFGSSEDAAAVFKRIGKEAWIDPACDYLQDVIKGINRSTDRVWPRFRATLMRDYFNSPWAFVSFLAAVVLLVFAFFQTFFSAFPKFALEK